MTCPPPETLSAAFDLSLRADAIDNDSTKSSCNHHEGRFQQTGRRYGRAVVKNVTSADGRGACDLSEVRLLKEANQQLHREVEDLRTTVTRLQGTSPASDGSYPPPLRQSSRLIGTIAQKRLPRDECRRCGGKGH